MRRLTIVQSLLAAVALAACSSAGQGGSASGESAVASPPAVAARVPANTRPETLPTPEPSRLETPPIVPVAPDTVSGGPAVIARLEREAHALAHTRGCASAQRCRVAPVGAKACGGPRTYIGYCAATTDTLALMRKLHELERVEKAYNARSGMMSSCEMRLAPVPTLVGNSCREGGNAP